MTDELTPPYVRGEPLPNVDAETQACFPTQGIIHRAMHHLAETSYTSSIHHLAAVIPAVANLMAQRGWHTATRQSQTAVQTLIVGPSGSGKSAALREVMRLVAEVDELYWGSAYDRMKHNRWLEAEGTMAGLVEGLHDMHLENLDTVPPSPLVSWPVNGTPVVLYHEEFSSVLSKRDAMLETILQLFDPKPRFERNLAMYRAMARRGEQPPSFVERPAVSAVFCTTLSALQGVFKQQHIDGGLSQRFSWAYGEGDRERIRLDAPDRPSERTEVARDWVAALRYWDRWYYQAGGPHRAQRVIHTAPEVKAYLNTALKQIKLAHKNRDFPTVSQRIRAVNSAHALSQIYAWSRGTTLVHMDDMRQAVAFYERSIQSFNYLRDYLDTSSLYSQAKLLEEVIRARGRKGMPRSEMYKVLRCSKPELDMVLDSLKDQEAVTRVTISPKAAKRGRPVERWMSTEFELRAVESPPSTDADDEPVAQDA